MNIKSWIVPNMVHFFDSSLHIDADRLQNVSPSFAILQEFLTTSPMVVRDKNIKSLEFVCQASYSDNGDLGCIVSGSGLEIANINDFVSGKKRPDSLYVSRNYFVIKTKAGFLGVFDSKTGDIDFENSPAYCGCDADLSIFDKIMVFDHKDNRILPFNYEYIISNVSRLTHKRTVDVETYNCGISAAFDFVFDEKECRCGKVYLWDLSDCDEKIYCRHQEGTPIRLIDINLSVSRPVADSDFSFDNCVKLSPHIKLSSMLIHVIDKYRERAI